MILNAVQPFEATHHPVLVSQAHGETCAQEAHKKADVLVVCDRFDSWQDASQGLEALESHVADPATKQAEGV